VKKIKAITASLIMLVGIFVLALSIQEVEAQQLQSVNEFQNADTTKGDLYGNAQGTKFCCKQSHDRDCGAAYCK